MRVKKFYKIRMLLIIIKLLASTYVFVKRKIKKTSAKVRLSFTYYLFFDHIFNILKNRKIG